MLDGVFNHCGFLHPMFQDVVKLGINSKYKDCFFIHEFPVVDFELNEHGKPKRYQNRKNRYETFGFTPMMPKWNTSHPLVEDYLLDVVTYWIKHYDIDGWRLDVSNEVSHDFLRKIRSVSRAIKKDVFILGENWDSSLPWLLGDQMDAVMNYDLSVPLWKFLEHQTDINTFKHDMNRYLARTPKHVIDAMFNLVCSHDTIRIKKRLNDDPRRMKIAYLLMFMQAGSPNIYYGDEVGMTGFHDPDNRRPMIWDPNKQDHEMYLLMKTLIHLKKALPLMSVPDISIEIIQDLVVIQKHLNEQILFLYLNYQDQKLDTIPHTHDLEIIIESGDLTQPYSYLLGVKHETNHS
jgi:glycosidase